MALVDALLIVVGGFVFVSLVIGVFLLITKVVAPRLLDEDDGSSGPADPPAPEGEEPIRR